MIFNDTVHNNVSLWDGSEDALEKVRPVARAVHADEFIEDLPDGYDTLLGDHGMRVSGGQRQRIAIARELYKNARVLIFDESTSALDTESEKIIQDKVDALRDKATLVLIAHRLSTVRNSDMIFVLEDGRIVEQGTYDYLCAAGGRFAVIVNHQAFGDSAATS